MLKDKINNLFAKKEGESNKKKMENIVVFLIILIITIIVINVIWNGDKTNNEDTQSADSNKRLASSEDNNIVQSVEDSASKDTLTLNLEEILSKINRSGKGTSYDYIFRNK